MNHNSQYIWISANPSFKNFHRPLLKALASRFEIKLWEYYQTPDENSSLVSAIDLLADYVESLPHRSLNLIGHGLGGTLALEYARQYPETIESLVLLSVPQQPAITWQYYYYQLLRSTRSSRQCILKMAAASLLPQSNYQSVRGLVNRLDRDLLEAPGEHSLWQLFHLPSGGVSTALAILQSQDDIITSNVSQGSWKNHLKHGDLFYEHESGGHFFHYFHPHVIAQKISQFWSIERQNRNYSDLFDRYYSNRHGY
jgi:pimeloyl-ACP methyl ester carboxylesterase